MPTWRSAIPQEAIAFFLVAVIIWAEAARTFAQHRTGGGVFLAVFAVP